MRKCLLLAGLLFSLHGGYSQVIISLLLGDKLNSDKILVFPFLKSLKEYPIIFNVSTLIFNGELRIERPGRDSNPGRRSDSPTY